MSVLKGEVALVTGGASGLGRAIVERFLNEDAFVTVLDRTPDRLARLVGARPDRLEIVAGDVRSYEDNRNAVDRCIARFGKLDCAVGNAGIWDYSKSLRDLPVERIDSTFDELFQVNVKGYLHLAKAALPVLLRSSGSLVFTVSNAGFDPGGGGPIYTASKHAVVGLIRQLAFELAPTIRVNGVAPGPIETDLRGPHSLGLAETSISSVGMSKSAAAVFPLGIVPEAADYAGGYVFLANRRDSRPATGGVINLDTGISIRGIGQVAGGTGMSSK